MGLADKQSRPIENLKKIIAIVKKSKETIWKKHVKKMDGKKNWVFDDGNVKEIPKDEERDGICKSLHEKLIHREKKYVLLDIRKVYYWPGIKCDVENICKRCEIC